MATDLKTTTSAAALSAALTAEPVDDFSTMFDQFSKPEDKTSTTASQAQTAAPDAGAAVVEPQTEIEGAPKTDTPEGAQPALTEKNDPAKPGDKPDGETHPTPGTDPNAKPQANADPGARQPATAAQDEFLSRMADLMAKGAQPAPQQDQRQTQQQPLYSANEVTAIQTFFQENPEQAVAVQAMLKGLAQNVVAHVFSEFGKHVGPRLALLDSLADRVTYDGLAKAVPEYNDELVGKVGDWIKTQPAYLQPAYNNVMQQGSESDIIDLVSRYRQTSGTSAPSAGDTTQQGTVAAGAAGGVKPATELSPAAKKAVAAMAPVNSKRSAPSQGDPVTFDDAFEQYAKAG